MEVVPKALIYPLAAEGQEEQGKLPELLWLVSSNHVERAEILGPVPHCLPALWKSLQSAENYRKLLEAGLSLSEPAPLLQDCSLPVQQPWAGEVLQRAAMEEE